MTNLTHASGSLNRTSLEIQHWLINAIAKRMNADPASIKIDVCFDDFGLDSLAAVELSGNLGDWLGRDLPGTLLFEYPTIRELSHHLAQPVEN